MIDNELESSDTTSKKSSEDKSPQTPIFNDFAAEMSLAFQNHKEKITDSLSEKHSSS